jgi:hypothetical protein
MTTYIIKYGIYFTTAWYQSGTIKVKNCHSSAHAKVKLEKYLRSKHPNFGSMVIYECVQKLPDFDIPDIFKDIFKL